MLEFLIAARHHGRWTMKHKPCAFGDLPIQLPARHKSRPGLVQPVNPWFS